MAHLENKDKVGWRNDRGLKQAKVGLRKVLENGLMVENPGRRSVGKSSGVSIYGWVFNEFSLVSLVISIMQIHPDIAVSMDSDVRTHGSLVGSRSRANVLAVLCPWMVASDGWWRRPKPA